MLKCVPSFQSTSVLTSCIECVLWSELLYVHMGKLGLVTSCIERVLWSELLYVHMGKLGLAFHCDVIQLQNSHCELTDPLPPTFLSTQLCCGQVLRAVAWLELHDGNFDNSRDSCRGSALSLPSHDRSESRQAVQDQRRATTHTCRVVISVLLCWCAVGQVKSVFWDMQLCCWFGAGFSKGPTLRLPSLLQMTTKSLHWRACMSASRSRLHLPQGQTRVHQQAASRHRRWQSLKQS